MIDSVAKSGVNTRYKTNLPVHPTSKTSPPPLSDGLALRGFKQVRAMFVAVPLLSAGSTCDRDADCRKVSISCAEALSTGSSDRPLVEMGYGI